MSDCITMQKGNSQEAILYSMNINANNRDYHVGPVVLFIVRVVSPRQSGDPILISWDV